MIEYATDEAVRFGYWRRRWIIRKGLRISVQPQTEPIDIVTARAHLRIVATGSPEAHPDDDLITNIYLPAARELVENYVGRACCPQTLELSLSEFPCDSIELPMAPLQGVESVTYQSDGAQTFVDYDVDTYAEPGRIQLSLNQSWPATDCVANAVVVRYIAGYAVGSPQDPVLPVSIKAAILLVLTNLYAGNPCEVLPEGVKSLLNPYKLPLGFA